MDDFFLDGSSFDRPLLIYPKKSFSITRALLLSHAVGMFVIISFLDIHLLVTLFLIIILIISFSYYFRWHVSKSLEKSVLSATHHFQQDKNIATTAIKGGQNWLICLSKQRELVVEILPSSFVHPLLIILNFKDQKNKRYTLLVPFDAISQEEHRQLRVRINVTI